MRILGVLILLTSCGCSFRDPDKPELVWGKRGVLPGEIVRPRAIVIDPLRERLYLVDFTARVQAFDLDGKHLGVTFTTPDYRNGRPSGLGVRRDGTLLVCDSHYHCLRLYSPEGVLLRTIEGDFGYVSDAVEAPSGCLFVSEFGTRDRISKLSPDGRLLQAWGKSGDGSGEFNRVRALAFGPDGLLYVADACNHRIQVFREDGSFVREFGRAGDQLGQLSYPYDLAFTPTGELVVAEYGNHRIQWFRPTGEGLATWGRPGRGAGELASPWALAVAPNGSISIVDTENHRIQRLPARRY